MKAWTPKRPVKAVKVSINTIFVSRNPVSLAFKISHVRKKALKVSLPVYGRGKATVSV